MDGEYGEDGLTKLGVAGALCREYASDERAFLGFMADSLQKALGSDVELGYQGGFLTKKTLKSLAISFGDDRYTLEDVGRGPLKATFTHVVRGIALKTQPMTVEDWLADVAELIEQKAATHAASRKALAEMLGLS